MHVEPYELKMDEVAAGKHPCILIDDSGTPGQEAGSPYLHPSRKTWVAVVTTATQIKEVCQQFPGALEELRSRTGASEFHFTDIYQRAGAFKDTPLKVRLAIFGFMRGIFSVYKFPIIVQTFSSENLAEVRRRASFPDRVGPFNMTQQSDAALLFLLIRVKWFLREHGTQFSSPPYVVLDEDFRPAGSAIGVPNFEHVFQRGRLLMVRSCDFLPIQLADFGAFCIGRTQWLLTKERRNRTDNEFLPIMADLRLNVVNLPEASADLQTWSSRDYERLIDQDRRGKGLEPYREDA